MDARMDPEWEKRLTDAVVGGNVRNVEELIQQTPMNLTSPDSRNNLLMKTKCINILKLLLQNQWIKQSINDVAWVRKTAFIEQILKSSNEADCLSRVKLLIDAGASISAMIFWSGRNALCKIISNGWYQLFNYIVDHIDDINSFSIEGQNILHDILLDNTDYVVKDNILYFVKNLVERGLDIRSEDKKNGNTPLMLSCKAGYCDLVTYLHRRGADVNIVNNLGETALMMACDGGHKEIVEYLIQHGGADVNMADEDGWTALMMACKKRHKEIVEYLIQHGGAALNQVDNNGLKALMIACRKGHKEILEYLLQHGGADVNMGDNYGWTALMIACRKGHKEIVEYLIQHGGADVNMADEDGWTALMMACREGHKEIVEYLIQHGGADVYEVDNNGLTALMIACRKGHKEILEYLLQHGGADVNMGDNYGWTALMIACRKGHKKIVEYLLQHGGADVNKVNKGGKTPLMIACIEGHKETVEYLIQHGRADVNMAGVDGETALMKACREGHKEIVEYLTQHGGADVNKVNKHGETALMMACRKGHKEIVEDLIQPISHGGADVNMVNKYGQTALMRACDCGHNEIVKYLIQHGGADVNKVNINGETPLMMACSYGFKEIADDLIQNGGADVNISDYEGNTAIGYLVEKRRHPRYNVPLFKLLVESGADLTSNGCKLIQVILNEKLKGLLLCLIGVKPHIGGLTAESENILHLLATLNFNFTLDNFDWLLDYKVDINHKNSNTDSPLMIAAVLLNVKYLKVFTRHPAVDINIHNNNGHTALHCLILGFAKFFQRIPPSQGDNYIRFLCQHLYPSYMECVDILLGAGIDVNIQDNEGKTVLMMAARENDKQLIRKLLDAGAMADKVDSSGRYALHYLDISDSVYDLTVFLLLLPSGRDSFIDAPCIHGNTFLQTVLQFPRLWNPCNVVLFLRWLIYRNCSLQHLRAEKGQSAYNDLSLDEFRPSERHELRRLLYLSGAPQEEIIAAVNFQVEDKAEDKFHSRRKFKTLCFNLQSKCIRFLRQLFGTGIKEKLSELEISHFHNSPLLQDIIADSTRIKEEQKRITDELKRLLLLDDDASDNNSLQCKCIRVIKQLLGTRVKDKIVRLQLPENIFLGEFNYVDDESEYCAYTVDKNRETDGRKYKYKVNMMLYHDDDDTDFDDDDDDDDDYDDNYDDNY